MTGQGRKVVRAARSWIGTPYRHQASVRGVGTDCLGLIRGVWRDVLGAEPEVVPAYSMDWSEPQGEEHLWQAALRNLRPVSVGRQSDGDVLLLRMRDGGVAKHLAISARQEGTETFIHAYGGRAVVESPLSLPWRRRIVARFSFPEERDQWLR